MKRRSHARAVVILVTAFCTASAATPVEVTSVAILMPRAGSQIASAEAVYPRGLLAIRGTGTVTGSWLLDGVPFDRFVVNAVAGRPVPVTSHVPIPRSARGLHGLQLSVEWPQRLASPAVQVIQTMKRASEFRLLDPVDDAVLRRTALRFRWTPVPGASSYEVELEPISSPPRLIHQGPEPQWSPSAAELDNVGTHDLKWRVVPLLPGDVHGDPTPWRRLTILPDRIRLTLSSPERDATTGRLEIRWQADSEGSLYRVELIPENDKAEPFLALTHNNSYLVPPHALKGAGDYIIRVSALDLDGESLGSSEIVVPLADQYRPR